MVFILIQLIATKLNISWDSIAHFVVKSFKMLMNAASTQGRIQIDELISEKSAIFAGIAVLFAIAIKNIPGDYIILFLLAFTSLEVIDKVAQIEI